VVATDTESNTASTAILRGLAPSSLFGGRSHHAFEDLDFAQGNAELLVGFQDFRIDLVERGHRLLRLGRRVVIEILVIDLGIVDPRPFRLGHGQPAAIGFQPPFQHPGRLVLLRGYEANGIFRQALGGLVRLDKRLKSISILVDVDPANPIDRLLYSRHSILRSRFQGPRWINSRRLLRCSREEITCLEPFKPCFVAIP
jgi:hypothetical protein